MNKFYAQKQLIHFASLLKKITNKEPIHIVCQGDSMTYGHDEESDDIRPPKTDPTCEKNAEYPDHTQAGTTYPEALQKFCNQMFGKDQVKITNRGFSGDWAERSRERWKQNPHADLHFLMLGTNEAMNPYIDPEAQLNITKYVRDMGNLIEQLLDFGSAVILLTPPNHSRDDNLLLTNFREILNGIGASYHIPVIDTMKFLKGYPYGEVQCDEVHYNTKGYTIFAAKIAAVLAGIRHLYKPFRLTGEEKVLVPSFYEYGLILNEAKGKTIELMESNEAPFGIGRTKQKGLMFKIPEQSSLTIAFYAEKGDLLLIPLLEINDPAGNLVIQLDFGIEQGRNSILEQTVHTEQENFKLHYERPLNILSQNQISFTAEKDKEVYIPLKGFYTLMIENLSSTDFCYVYGFQVKNAETKLLSPNHRSDLFND